MSTIVTRAGKGSALTHNEVDANFTNLNTDKVEKSGTDPVVISANSSSNALRITQTGTGNALVVEDSTNPDSTPFVVDASGRTYVGNTTSYAVGLTDTPLFQISTTNSSTAQASVGAYNNATSAGKFTFVKSRSGTNGTLGGIVASGDEIGTIAWRGDDGAGANPLLAASILAAVDGTPGTNDMPGRLVFSTTADGASSPTERMRIDSAGRVGIGTSNLAGTTVRIGTNITGAVTSYGLFNASQVQSDVTTSARAYSTSIGTANVAFTLVSLDHYRATQGTFGASSTVTNQYGFTVDSSLTGATNNYGFFSNIASGTGRWNFYANGTAENFFGGVTTFRAANAIRSEAASTQDAIVIAGRAGGTSSYAVTLTPATLASNTTLTLPNVTDTVTAIAATQTLTNKRITPRVTTTTSSATPTINTDTTDQYGLTAQAVDITSFTTNLSGTPTDGQKLWIYIVGTAARAITWGASFESSTITLPTTTVSTNRLDVGFVWNAATSKWRCVATA